MLHSTDGCVYFFLFSEDVECSCWLMDSLWTIGLLSLHSEMTVGFCLENLGCCSHLFTSRCKFRQCKQTNLRTVLLPVSTHKCVMDIPGSYKDNPHQHFGLSYHTLQLLQITYPQRINDGCFLLACFVFAHMFIAAAHLWFSVFLLTEGDYMWLCYAVLYLNKYNKLESCASASVNIYLHACELAYT